jgi:hypothetical protein
MEAILQRLSQHPAIEVYGRHNERFANVSLAQEALLVAAFYKNIHNP